MAKQVKIVVTAENLTKGPLTAAQTELNNLKTKIKKTTASMHGMHNASGVLDRSLMGLRRTMMLYGGILFVTMFMKALIGTMGRLEQGWIDVAKTTGMAGKELDKLKISIKKLSIEMKGITLEEFQKIAQTAGQLGRRGVEDITEFTRVIGMVTVATDLLADDASRGFGQMMNAMKIPIEGMETMGSILNELSNTTAAYSSEIVDMTKAMAGPAFNLGLTVGEVMALAATMKDLGVQTEVGATAFIQVFQKMLTRTKSFAELSGMSMKNYSKLLFDNPIEAIKAFMEALSKLDKQARATALKDLGMESKRVGGTMMIMAAGTKELNKSLATQAEQLKTNTSLVTEYNTASKKLFAEATSAGNAIKILADEIGRFLLPALKKVLPVIRDVAMEMAKAFGADFRTELKKIEDEISAIKIGPFDMTGMLSIVDTSERLNELQKKRVELLKESGMSWAEIATEATRAALAANQVKINALLKKNNILAEEGLSLFAVENAQADLRLRKLGVSITEIKEGNRLLRVRSYFEDLSIKQAIEATEAERERNKVKAEFVAGGAGGDREDTPTQGTIDLIKLNEKLTKQVSSLAEQYNKLNLPVRKYIALKVAEMRATGASEITIQAYVKVLNAAAEAEKKLSDSKKQTALNKQLVNQTARLNEEYRKTTLTTEEYNAAKVEELLLNGANLDNVIDFIAAQERLNDVKKEEKRIKDELAVQAEAERIRLQEARFLENADRALGRGRSDIEVELDVQERRLAQLDNFYLAKFERAQTSAQQEDALNEWVTTRDAAMRERSFRFSGMVAKQFADLAMNLYEATGKKNKALFYASKSFAVAQAVINTLVGVTKALSQGGFWGIVMGVAVLAAGLASVAKIVATKPGDSSTSVSGGGGSTTVPPVDATTPPPSAEAQQYQNIEVNIYTQTGQIDEVAADEIIRVINDAGENRNVRINANAIAREDAA